MLDQIENIQFLQGCLNDLVSLLSLPALWSGREPPQVLGILLDVLLRMLQLDFAYARLNAVASTAPSEMYRVAERQKTTPEPQEIGRALEPWLRLNRPGLASVVSNPVGKREVTMVCVWLGFDPERGVVVAGSKRADFPTDIERASCLRVR